MNRFAKTVCVNHSCSESSLFTSSYQATPFVHARGIRDQLHSENGYDQPSNSELSAALESDEIAAELAQAHSAHTDIVFELNLCLHDAKKIFV